MENTRDVFMALDKGGDGRLSHDDFREGMRRLGLGLTEKQVNELINAIDKDGDGEIEYVEFGIVICLF